MDNLPTTLGTRDDNSPSHLDMRHGPVSQPQEALLNEDQFNQLLDHMNAIMHPLRERMAAVLDSVEKMAADVAATHAALMAGPSEAPPQPADAGGDLPADYVPLAPPADATYSVSPPLPPIPAAGNRS